MGIDNYSKGISIYLKGQKDPIEIGGLDYDGTPSQITLETEIDTMEIDTIEIKVKYRESVLRYAISVADVVAVSYLEQKDNTK